MQQEIVQSGDGIKHHCLNWRAKEFHQGWNAARLEDGQQALSEMNEEKQ